MKQLLLILLAVTTIYGQTPITVNRAKTSGTADVALALSGTAVVPATQISGTIANPSWLASLAYSKLINAPALSSVALSGSYNDLLGRPTLLSQFANDAGFITSSGTAANITGTIQGSQVSGLGSAAFVSSAAFATSAQGAKADSSAQFPDLSRNDGFWGVSSAIGTYLSRTNFSGTNIVLADGATLASEISGTTRFVLDSPTSAASVVNNELVLTVGAGRSIVQSASTSHVAGFTGVAYLRFNSFNEQISVGFSSTDHLLSGFEVPWKGIHLGWAGAGKNNQISILSNFNPSGALFQSSIPQPYAVIGVAVRLTASGYEAWMQGGAFSSMGALAPSAQWVKVYEDTTGTISGNLRFCVESRSFNNGCYVSEFATTNDFRPDQRTVKTLDFDPIHDDTHIGGAAYDPSGNLWTLWNSGTNNDGDPYAQAYVSCRLPNGTWLGKTLVSNTATASYQDTAGSLSVINGAIYAVNNVSTDNYATVSTPKYRSLSVSGSSIVTGPYNSFSGLASFAMNYQPAYTISSGSYAGRILVSMNNIHQWWALYSDNGGATWTEGTKYYGPGGADAYETVMIEEGPSNKLVAYTRVSNGTSSQVLRYTTPDGGATWVSAGTIAVPECHSRFQCARIANGNIALIGNDSTVDYIRNNTTIWILGDNGIVLGKLPILPGFGGENYPGIAASKWGTLACVMPKRGSGGSPGYVLFAEHPMGRWVEFATRYQSQRYPASGLARVGVNGDILDLTSMTKFHVTKTDGNNCTFYQDLLGNQYGMGFDGTGVFLKGYDKYYRIDSSGNWSGSSAKFDSYKSGNSVGVSGTFQNPPGLVVNGGIITGTFPSTQISGTSIAPGLSLFNNAGTLTLSGTATNPNYVTASGSVAYSGSTGSVPWANVQSKPSFATVATSGSYSDISGRPTLLSQFTNDPGYITSSGSVVYSASTGSVPWSSVQGKPSFSAVATSGSYGDLLGRPTSVSQFANDSGYVAATGTVANITGTIPVAQVSGLGSAALASSSSFATSAQGAKADTAIQPATLASGTALTISGTLPVSQVSGISGTSSVPGLTLSNNSGTITISGTATNPNYVTATGTVASITGTIAGAQVTGTLNNIAVTSLLSTSGTLLSYGGSGNIFVGDGGLKITSGNQNVSLGSLALLVNTSGNNNTAVGRASLWSNSTGSSNTAVGQNCMIGNTTGQQNTVLGASAMYGSSTGSYNAVVGVNAMFSNSTGGNNAAFGWSAMQNNGAGGSNTGIGTSAIFSNAGGSQNTSVGCFSLYSGTFASNNIGIGFSAGRYSQSTGMLFIDAFDRSNSAGDLSKALITGSMTSAGTGQWVALNGSLTVNSPGTGNVVQTVKGIAGQTADLQQWQDSAGNVVASVSASGGVSSKSVSQPIIDSVRWAPSEITFSGSGSGVANSDIMSLSTGTTANSSSQLKWDIGAMSRIAAEGTESQYHFLTKKYSYAVRFATWNNAGITGTDSTLQWTVGKTTDFGTLTEKGVGWIVTGSTYRVSAVLSTGTSVQTIPTDGIVSHVTHTAHAIVFNTNGDGTFSMTLDGVTLKKQDGSTLTGTMPATSYKPTQMVILNNGTSTNNEFCYFMNATTLLIK